jgi:type IV pilus assembly protein PilW
MTSRTRQRGFSLLEIMVGVAIGMIGIVVIFQSLAVWESRKRTTGSGSDAQIAGSIAIFNIERDARLAGYGFGQSAAMGCTVSAYDSTRGTPDFTFGLYPVEIVNGASGAPDELKILRGNSANFTAGQPFTLSSTTTKKMQGGRTAFQINDLIMVTQLLPTSPCAMVQVTGNTNADGLTIDHASGVRYNSAGGTSGYTSGTIYNVGTYPQLNHWRINGNVLQWADLLHASTTWFDISEGIVNLQAEYGIDGYNANAVDNQIVSGEWTATTPADWTKVRAIRVALLSRSQQFEKDLVTPNAPSWAGGTFTMANLDGTAGTTTPTDPAMHWQHYRYRVYEQVVPLRNVIWGTAP